MKNEIHFICTVRDCLNNEDIWQNWTNQTAELKAKKAFLKMPFVKRHLGNERYKISFRANSVLIQDTNI